MPRWRIVNTWNGGAHGRKVEFVSKADGPEGHNECFKWIHDNTSFSFHEATVNQGYVVEPEPEPENPVKSHPCCPSGCARTCGAKCLT